MPYHIETKQFKNAVQQQNLPSMSSAAVQILGMQQQNTERTGSRCDPKSVYFLPTIRIANIICSTACIIWKSQCEMMERIIDYMKCIIMNTREIRTFMKMFSKAQKIVHYNLKKISNLN